ncbi:MAG: methyltransferase domain-containing protein [Candidatus Pacebacteria bacterium]|nr:methyltransferase domain-containing protein [Candidatus Paceibacterota bacterium]
MDWKKLEQPYYLRSKKYEGGKYLSLNRKHKGVLEYLDFALEKINKDGVDFCDAGCGNGIYLKFLKENRTGLASLCGFDFSEKIVELAKENTGLEEIKIGNLENAPFGNEKFDLILCTQVIEHLLEDKRGIAELYRMLRKGGYLVISTDNTYNIISEFLNLPFRILSLPYALLKKIFRDKKYFPHKSYSIKEFKNLIGVGNFEIEKVSTFRFSMPFPFYKIKAMRDTIDFFEMICGKIGIFKNNGDIVIALCKKI